MSETRNAIKTVLCVAAIAAAFLLGYIVRSFGDSSTEGIDGHMVYGTAVSVAADSRVVCIGDAHAAVCGDVLNGELPIIGDPVRGWLLEVPATDNDDATIQPTWGMGHRNGLMYSAKNCRSA